MRKSPEFTIEDLVKEPVADYGNYEGENRVFIIFDAISTEMMKLKEGDEFSRGCINFVESSFVTIITPRITLALFS